MLRVQLQAPTPAAIRRPRRLCAAASRETAAGPRLLPLRCLSLRPREQRRFLRSSGTSDVARRSEGRSAAHRGPSGGPSVPQSSQGAPTHLSRYTAPAGGGLLRARRGLSGAPHLGGQGRLAHAHARRGACGLWGAGRRVSLPGSAVAGVASFPRLLCSGSARGGAGG